jgi:hypothetical protein
VEKLLNYSDLVGRVLFSLGLGGFFPARMGKTKNNQFFRKNRYATDMKSKLQKFTGVGGKLPPTKYMAGIE